MAEEKNQFACNPLDLNRFRRLLEEEFNRFRHDFEIRPITEAQDLRALLIAWVAVFLPEAVTDDLINKVKDFLTNIRERKDFLYEGWYSVIDLDIALFAATNQSSWLYNHRYNFDHHNSTIREFLTRSLALVADRISFDDEELLNRTARNLSYRHSYSEYCLIILAVSKGDVNNKVKQFTQWISNNALNEKIRYLLKQLSMGDFVTNSLLWHFLWVQQYITLRIACYPYVPSKQLLLPGTEQYIHAAPIKKNKIPTEEQKTYLPWILENH